MGAALVAGMAVLGYFSLNRIDVVIRPGRPRKKERIRWKVRRKVRAGGDEAQAFYSNVGACSPPSHRSSLHRPLSTLHCHMLHLWTAPFPPCSSSE